VIPLPVHAVGGAAPMTPNEFDFRMNTRAKLGINDSERSELALKGMKGKRLSYETTTSEATA
jgi:hypothetical protein